LAPAAPQRGRAAWKALAWMGTTGWPAASSRSTTRPPDCSIATGSSSGRPQRPSRTTASPSPVSVWGGVQWSTTRPVSSITVTSWVALAQSQPTTSRRSYSLWSWCSSDGPSLVAGALLTALKGQLPEAGLWLGAARGGTTQTGHRVARHRGRPLTRTTSNPDSCAGCAPDTPPIRQRMISRWLLPWAMRRLVEALVGP
jgi:hypothetical protein